MFDQFSNLPYRVRPNPGIAQWVECKYTHSTYDESAGKTINHVAVPPLMPGTIIFVHGVNSEGEWYEQAEKQFCDGLKKRLGRTDLHERNFDREANRFESFDADASVRSPVIPFYWGWKRNPDDLNRYLGIYHNRHDQAWGGGPFQNGCNNLLSFWQEGFKKDLLAGWFDLQKHNPEIDRILVDAPPRDYMIHAAQRLANLVETIRADCPNEPINIVAHSQGNMITLCAMLFLDKATRAPDTLILNNAPYAFDNKVSDWLSAAHGFADMQSEDARVQTFANVAKRIADATVGYPAPETLSSTCLKPAIKGIDTAFMQYEPNGPQQHLDIGTQPVNDKGQSWHECQHSKRDNRGKIFVNFNPNDRVIGVSAVEGIGWRGIPAKYLSGPPDAINPDARPVTRFPNVYQRIFVRNSDGKTVAQVRDGDVMDDAKQGKLVHPPAVGAKSGYWFSYFHVRQVRQAVKTDFGGALTDQWGGKVNTENPYLFAYDGAQGYDFWNPIPKKMLHLVDIQGTPGENEKVWINAPIVPNPAVLDDQFNSSMIRFDGKADDATSADESQQTDFSIYAYQQTIRYNKDGTPETSEQKEQRLSKLGETKVPQTDHSKFLTYDVPNGRPVAQVISYDLTVGQGYAWADPQYWDYLLHLADWKLSDPYYQSGKLQKVAPPADLDTHTVSTRVAEADHVGA